MNQFDGDTLEGVNIVALRYLTIHRGLDVFVPAVPCKRRREPLDALHTRQRGMGVGPRLKSDQARARGRCLLDVRATGAGTVGGGVVAGASLDNVTE